MSDVLGGVRGLIDQPGAALRADAGSVRWAAPDTDANQHTGVSWSPTPLPASLPPDDSRIAREHDAFSLVVDSRAARLHSGISGAVPIYMDAGSAPDKDPHVHFCSRIEPLARTQAGGARPDWDAWAHILAAGGPLGGRTVFAGIHRMQPWSRITVTPGSAPEVNSTGWPWLDVDAVSGASVDTVRDALAETVSALGMRQGLTCLLSGGWDSRVLTAIASGLVPEQLTAWTTSSDTGTVMEELVAAKVAGMLGIQHEIVPPVRDDFGADLEHFARSVDYQTSFHVWLVPLARALAGTSRTVLDGLGGGLFVGGAFPDEDSERPILDRRFDRLARYLHGAEEILDARVVEQLRERTRASFDTVAAPLVNHPFGSTFTAYLTRTLPGISLAPYGLLSSATPVATPFLDDAVVRAALAIPAEQHADGRLYPELLRPFAPQLADLPTALELTPQERPHQRRVSSAEAARVLRDIVTREPVRQLLSPELVVADLDIWRKYLNLTRPQHLIRGLATLSLWLDHYEDVLDGSGIDALLGRG
ncbi:asparagine synthase-related protein [Phytoactinopolyspora mesophila]|nr:asparagine synthase-related protein [Phytoactinopolyspora mesophila]